MNKSYKYALEKGSKKFLCPKCEQKTFVKYINQETGEYLSETIGRCDRETNCGHHNIPNNEFIKAEEYNSFVKPIQETSYHEECEVNLMYHSNTANHFIEFLSSIFETNEVERIKDIFKISTSTIIEGSTVFWQIDEKNLIHAGKVMLYNKNTGKRFKSINNTPVISWMHKINKRKDFNLNQCLFGLHQLQNRNNQNQTIGIVESEKTAVLITIMYPDNIWMATGSKHGFKESMLLAIKDFKIIAFPDKSEYNDWSSKALKLNSIGFNITINNWLEETDYDIGADLADVIIDLKRL